MASVQPVGDLLRAWRQRRRLSQLDLACEAEISTRHLSFLETGRSRPSREMLLRLAEQLAVPLRERNALLLAAGYAPVYPERTLDDPALHAARQAIDLVLAGHEPCPALALRPFRLATEAGILSFISKTTIFGTPIDITLSEIAVESFFPADAATDAALRAGLRTRRSPV